MIASVDWYGISAVISAVFAGTATVIAALANRKAGQINTQVTPPNGTPHTLAELTTNTAAAVTAAAIPHDGQSGK